MSISYFFLIHTAWLYDVHRRHSIWNNEYSVNFSQVSTFFEFDCISLLFNDNNSFLLNHLIRYFILKTVSLDETFRVLFTFEMKFIFPERSHNLYTDEFNKLYNFFFFFLVCIITSILLFIHILWILSSSLILFTRFINNNNNKNNDVFWTCTYRIPMNPHERIHANPRPLIWTICYCCPTCMKIFENG